MTGQQVQGLLLRPTTTPPLLDVPTYSLATCQDNDHNNTSNMNILTYATPVSIRPDRLWSLGLFHDTLTYQNFAATKQGVLQLLRPCHAELVKVLGGSSGRDVDKQSECETLGYPWIKAPAEWGESAPELLPDCVCYLQMSLVGENLIDCGSHSVAICKVESMWTSKNDEEPEDVPHLHTARLREMGIITPQGRVAE
uniref:Flavin reductase like domain-containing protein n=1 Tax=Entomoneis paludosa TaxID=265537 RepID=A0A7S2Y493_9STRA